MNKKVSAIIILILILVGIGGYLLWRKDFISIEQTSNWKTDYLSKYSIKDETINWKNYASGLGYSVNYPSDWNVSVSATTPVKADGLLNIYSSTLSVGEESIQPSQPELFGGVPFQYFVVMLDTSQFNPVVVRTFEQVRKSEKENFGGRDRIESPVIFAGEKGYAYTEKFDDKKSFLEIIVQHDKKIYHIFTQKYNLDEVKKIFASFKFKK